MICSLIQLSSYSYSTPGAVYACSLAVVHDFRFDSICSDDLLLSCHNQGFWFSLDCRFDSICSDDLLLSCHNQGFWFSLHCRHSLTTQAHRSAASHLSETLSAKLLIHQSLLYFNTMFMRLFYLRIVLSYRSSCSIKRSLFKVLFYILF